MKSLKDFIHRFDFVRMKPDKSFIKSGLPDKARVQALAEPGKQYAAYLKSTGIDTLTLTLPKGSYRIEWLNVLTGETTKREEQKHAGGDIALKAPANCTEAALRLKAR
jgi:hypothetical protein